MAVVKTLGQIEAQFLADLGFFGRLHAFGQGQPVEGFDNF